MLFINPFYYYKTKDGSEAHYKEEESKFLVSEAADIKTLKFYQ
jgi:hypothetical protein